MSVDFDGIGRVAFSRHHTALDHEAIEMLRLAADFLAPEGNASEPHWYVLSFIRGEGSSVGQWQFNMEYEADFGFDPIKVTWRVWTDTDSVDGDPPRTRTKVMKVEVSRG